MKVDIETRYLEHVKSIINSHLQDPSLKIYVFGSRARGNAKKYSDLDIALQAESKIEVNKMSKIEIELEETTIPYKVDVIDLNNISDTFRKCIENDLVEV
ncbi:MAG: nucleotidyltransferase domain-containing protein [bacterium]